MTRTETNKQIVVRFITELFTHGDLSAVDRDLDPGFVNHDPPLPGSPDGLEGMRQAAEVFRRAFPDWRSEVQQLIAEGDIVVERFIARGTHSGSVMGEQPTEREVVLRGINIFRIADDKIVERWGRLDELGLLQQLGVSAAQPAAAGSPSLQS
jgi:predicted ester cyclase